MKTGTRRHSGSFVINRYGTVVYDGAFPRMTCNPSNCDACAHRQHMNVVHSLPQSFECDCNSQSRTLALLKLFG